MHHMSIFNSSFPGYCHIHILPSLFAKNKVPLRKEGGKGERGRGGKEGEEEEEREKREERGGGGEG
jgi:hypothetical protein